jgi:transcriptional regulator with XRE-family HTH domain
MKPQELKRARLNKGWGQSQAAARLGVSQAYLTMLENGKRPLTPKMVHKAVTLFDLSAECIPVPENFMPSAMDTQHLAESLSKLGYPGFAHLRSRLKKKNPGEVLLTALRQENLDARVAEALPWLALHYWGFGSWVVQQARQLNLQNRLGFVVNLARQMSERGPQNDNRTAALRELETQLNDSRLVKEDVFYRAPRTDGEREWLLQNRTEEARHWNLLSDLRVEHLQYAE